MGFAGSVSVGRRFCHSGLILILLVFSSYVMMPCVDRNCENSVSLSVCTLIWPDRSVMLCHFPSFMMAKSFVGGQGFSLFNIGAIAFKSGRTSGRGLGWFWLCFFRLCSYRGSW